MTDILTLADNLRALPDAALETLLTERRVAPSARAQDFFDLAELLLDPSSIRGALQRLDRRTLSVLAAATTTPLPAAEIADRLSAFGAADVNGGDVEERAAFAADRALLSRAEGGYAAIDAVEAVLATWPTPGIPIAVHLVSAPAPALPAAASEASHALTDLSAAEHAFQTTSASGELLLELLANPARELGKGGPALPERKRLATVMQVHGHTIDAYLDLTVRAGLVSHIPGLWLTAPAGEDWLALTAGERWRTLAAAWLNALPSQVRTVLSGRTRSTWGSALHDYAQWLYPAGGDWIRGQVARVTDQAIMLGITSGPTPDAQVPSTAGRILLETDAAAAATAMASNFPTHVSHVYLQHDLTVIAPGPLEPGLDVRLRTFADLEGRAQAFSYRLSAESVNRALSAGETSAGMLEFLSSLSLTGIPQPVDHLISQAASRFGAIRVGSIPDDHPDALRDAKTYVRAADSALIGLLDVDQSLASLGLRRTDSDRMLSRFDLEVVFWAISDARYPVAAETATGELIGLRRRRVAPPVDAPPPLPDHGILIGRLREVESDTSTGTDLAWIARQLDAAIRAKQTVTITVEVPRSGPMDFVLEPTGVSGGRLRGRDKKADIERTLPLSSIIALK
ncbi:helicase-associated domain-containing protein [Mycetocola sp.]|uniref:helicase-associated domain-containing protein n=1 Tax=Mycetocola sp. TaxID=1871042 RepID=UPI003988B32F